MGSLSGCEGSFGGRPRRFLPLELLELFSASGGIARGVATIAVGAEGPANVCRPLSPSAVVGAC
jgi:hypothetical protein